MVKAPKTNNFKGGTMKIESWLVKLYFSMRGQGKGWKLAIWYQKAQKKFPGKSPRSVKNKGIECNKPNSVVIMSKKSGKLPLQKIDIYTNS